MQQLWQLYSPPSQQSRSLYTSSCQHQHQKQQQLHLLQSNTRQQPPLHIQQALPQLLQQLLQHQAGHQLQQQRGVKQLRPYGETPNLPPKFRRPDKDGRMNRMVIRIPPQVQVAVTNGQLVLTGRGNQDVGSVQDSMGVEPQQLPNLVLAKRVCHVECTVYLKWRLCMLCAVHVAALDLFWSQVK